MGRGMSRISIFVRIQIIMGGACGMCPRPSLLFSLLKTRDYRFTVPFLWDTKEHTLVNNESSEIIRMFNSEFNELLPREKAELDLYPANIAAEIDELNEWVYDGINSAFFSCDVWLFF